MSFSSSQSAGSGKSGKSGKSAVDEEAKEQEEAKNITIIIDKDGNEKKMVTDNHGNTYEWKPKDVYQAELKAKREANKKKKWDDKPMSPEDKAKLDARKAEWVGKTVKGVLLKRRGGFFIRFSDKICENVFCSEKNVIACLGENKTPGMVAIVRCKIEKFGPPWKAWDKQHPITRAVELVTRYARRGRDGENLAEKRKAMGLSARPQEWEKNVITKDVDVAEMQHSFHQQTRAQRRNTQRRNKQFRKKRPSQQGINQLAMAAVNNQKLRNQIMTTNVGEGRRTSQEELEAPLSPQFVPETRQGYPSMRPLDDALRSGESHGLSKFAESGTSQGMLDEFAASYESIGTAKLKDFRGGFGSPGRSPRMQSPKGGRFSGAGTQFKSGGLGTWNSQTSSDSRRTGSSRFSSLSTRRSKALSSWDSVGSQQSNNRQSRRVSNRSRQNSKFSRASRRYSKRHPHPADDLGVVDDDRVPEEVKDKIREHRTRNKSRFSFANSPRRGSILEFDKGTKQKFKQNQKIQQKAVEQKNKQEERKSRRSSKGSMGPKARINQPMKKTSF